MLKSREEFYPSKAINLQAKASGGLLAPSRPLDIGVQTKFFSTDTLDGSQERWVLPA